jgi:hypothetical protein
MLPYYKTLIQNLAFCPIFLQFLIPWLVISERCPVATPPGIKKNSKIAIKLIAKAATLFLNLNY